MRNDKLSTKNISSNLLLYGTTHAVVDGVCAAVIFSILNHKIINTAEFAILVVLYGVLAFGLQPIFGLIVDHFKFPRSTVLLGCIMTGVSAIVFMSYPTIAIVLAGFGNALFHVGGGSISLNLTPQKATAPGIYVAPGALGLAVGTLLGKNGQFIAWPVILILATLCLLMFTIKKPEMNYEQKKLKEGGSNYFEFILLLVFLSIAIRSLVGMMIVFPWKTNVDLLITLTLAIVLGKGFGGFLADRFGWFRIGIGTLILSIPFLVLGANIPILAIVGMFLFNVTMPITLVVISNVLPGRPGFAFGLTCLALILGAFPSFTVLKNYLGGQSFIFVFIIFSLAALYFAFRFYFKNYPEKKFGRLTPFRSSNYN